MSNLALQVKDDIVAKIKNDQLVLPTLPEIALQVQEIAEDAATTIPQLTKIIAQDPAMTARIIKVTNSPLIRTSSPVTDLNTAISRLGIDFTSNLCVGLAMEQMFQATHDIIDKRMRSCWSRAMEVAATCQVLARHYTRLQPDQALLAGLIHQIGMLPILSYAEDNADLLHDSISLDLVLEKLHPSLGSYILRSWDFQPDLALVPKEYLNLKHTADSADYTDLVQVATLQSYAGSDHPLGKVNRTELGSFQRLGLAADEEVTQLEALSEEMEATQNALGM
ncbi:MAG: histidine kinase [Oceanospirillaceae bacterium]|uniref:HDOD domain-containing protein n=1 Tax=unclassified Thalassolituus TaxID=2624967 RepID=UPI000C09CA47|nr:MULTISPECIES: HDOD domain-containing protein [unclassified Thalassolituus]MAK92262.1 histidine kinase [Thalassolituus sp.]MAS23977.1 histidine kinase [Oceanospirillaceae bacterium]MAY00542.1 histidine kinase [Oceanospirillaceae bacterium]MBL35497.1 histidine kinase [Oceanospirillaceae bacterium]MBS53954.1 histidine kinase [Oceanospirillaceae bacterium]|tara:strand:- start:459 stop:1298 length:840 start_codon:yes stop_codon:yes gene_type:complete